MAEELKSFSVIEVKEITTKNGNIFTAYKTLGKGGRKLDLRFVKGCENVPTEKCTIFVKPENANVDNTRMYPILWIKNVEKIEPITRKNNLDDYFD